MTDFAEYLDYTAEELYEDWLNFITTRDPLLKDTSVASFNTILAEAVASEFWIFLQLLKQKVQDSSVLTAEGEALSAIVLSLLPEGRQAGTRATGVVLFSRPSLAESDITIPAGTICAAVAEDGSLIEFATDSVAVLEAGTDSEAVEATAISAGADGNVVTSAISIIRTPVVGISQVSNDAPFTGGTDEESDDDLRSRALYTIWVNGKATIPLMEEHIDGVAGVREVSVETLGQGDVLIVADAADDYIEDIDEMVLENLAAGCTACGVLGASLRDGAPIYEIGDTSGAPIWVRVLEFISTETTVEVTYTEPDGGSKSATVTFPGGSPAGTTLEATMTESFPDATLITASSYAGALSFDVFMGKGTYPRLWVAPELQEVDVTLEIVLTATPEADLLENIEASLTAKLDSYRVGEDLEFADLVKYIYVDYATGRAFTGIDDVSTFELTCKASTISAFGSSVALDNDERIEPGTISVTEA